jgi:pimeloyl-ACP methyl ester carboxylesterase
MPGSFSPATIYDEFAKAVKTHGINTRIIKPLSVGKRASLEPGTMSDDANEIARVASELLDAGENVILMTHSYGGIPGTQSLQSLSRASRTRDGKQGGVDKIIYLTSVVPPVGASNFDMFQGAMPDFVTVEVFTSARTA